MEVYKYFSHQHALRRFKIRPDGEGFSTCSVCELHLSAGPAYRCTKPKCDFFLHDSRFSLSHELRHGSQDHVGCTKLPDSVKHGEHPHPLGPLFTSLFPETEDADKITCSVCDDTVADQCWVYCCQHCNFNTHLNCAMKAADEPNMSESDASMEKGGGEGQASDYFRSLVEAQRNMELLHLQDSLHNRRMELQNRLFIQRMQRIEELGNIK